MLCLELYGVVIFGKHVRVSNVISCQYPVFMKQNLNNKLIMIMNLTGATDLHCMIFSRSF